ncbi:MAG: hydroxyacid dehydrogenase [Oscillospiraceae bacterium]|nr:hydroxyacid dehydrogenase [Oscillospiraceae bacterium]
MAKFKVYYTIELNQVATDIFEANDFEVKLCSHNDEETYVKELAEFQPDAIMCRTEPITAKMMDTCTNLKVIGKQGAGLDNIDMDHAAAKGLQVVFAPAGNANAVAEHAVLLMLACAKRFNYVDKQFRGGNFLVRMNMENTYELGGKTLGMIGCGRISQLAMQKCKYGFGMKVIGYDPFVKQEQIGDLCEMKETAKEVWEQADFISVHLPVVESTAYSIGREQFSWMKPTASFINCARGALIKENEMIECLKDGTLFQAGLDVFDAEPIKPESVELFDLDNVIMTPHMAATTEQSVLNCCTSVANDIVAVCNGEAPKCPAIKPKF